MMFLLRSAFWLVVLILLVPTDGEQQKKIYGMAQTAVADIGGFCGRNPDTCASGQYAINVLVQKAQYGAHMVQALVDGETGTFAPSRGMNARQTAENNRMQASKPSVDSAVMPVPNAVPIEPTPWIESDSQNTLRPQDLEAEWSGPNV